MELNIFLQILQSYFKDTGGLFLECALFVACCKANLKNTVVSRNTGEEKNLYQGDRKLIFLIDLIDF